MKSIHQSSIKGQSLVELALLLPVLLLLTVVTLDLGRAIYYYSAVYNAAKEGARYGIINPDDVTGIVNAAEKLTVGLDSVNVAVCECGGTNACILENACPAGYTDIIRVKVSYNFQLITPLADIVTGSDHIPLASISYVAIER